MVAADNQLDAVLFSKSMPSRFGKIFLPAEPSHPGNEHKGLGGGGIVASQKGWNIRGGFAFAERIRQPFHKRFVRFIGLWAGGNYRG